MTPTFSIVIFTKNRAELAAFALESVLRQTFDDFEVIVSDNDDGESTARALARFRNPRFRYHRTGGTLSMVDNWECGLEFTTGHYVLSLTDRSVLKRHALERIWRAISEHPQQDVFVWQYDLLYQRRDGDTLIRYSGPPDDEIVSSAALFDFFFLNPTERYSHRLPRGLNCCFSRSLLDELRATTGGRVCLPVAPDYIQAFLALVHRPTVAMINEPLFVWGGLALSNGLGTYDGTGTFQRFMHDLGRTEADLYDLVPVKTVGIHNMICNDLLHLKVQCPDRFSGVVLNLPGYFAVCYEEIQRWLAPANALYEAKTRAWKEALALQPSAVQAEVGQAVEVFERRRDPSRESAVTAFRRIQAEYQPGLNYPPWWTPLGVRRRAARLIKGVHRQVLTTRRPLPVYKFRSPVEAADYLEACERWERRHRGGPA